MPVRGLGRQWLWGNIQPEPLNLEVPVVCRHAQLINVKPITAQEKLFPQSQCLPGPHTGIALGTRLMSFGIVLIDQSHYSPPKFGGHRLV